MRTQLLTLDHLVQFMDPALYLHLQSAESTNFFFFFRMLIVWYKREFDWADILRLWEGLWTDYLSSNFHLFIALAILEKHRSVIMDHLKHFDEVLKYGKHFSPRLDVDLTCKVNELSNSIELQSILLAAEVLFRRFQRMVEAVDKKNNFPAPPIRQRKPVSAAPKTQNVGTSSSSDSRRAPPINKGRSTSPTEVTPKERVISPELRTLLSRKVVKLDKKDVADHGGGVGS